MTTGPSGVELTGKVLDEQKVYVQSIYWEGSLGDGFSDFDTVNVRLALQPDGPKGETYLREGSTTINSVKVRDKDSVEIDLQVYPPDEKDWYLKYKKKDT